MPAISWKGRDRPVNVGYNLRYGDDSKLPVTGFEKKLHLRLVSVAGRGGGGPDRLAATGSEGGTDDRRAVSGWRWRISSLSGFISDTAVRYD